MAVSKAKKQEILKDLSAHFSKAKSLVFVKNSGVGVKDVTEIKKELKKNNVDLKVAKKTLMQLAFKENNMPEVNEEVLSGPIMVAISYEDEMVGAKLLKKFIKTNEKLAFAGGIVDNQVFNKKEIIALADLPSKPELIATLLGALKSPLYGLHHALSYHLRGLAQVISQIQKQKEGQPV